MCDNLAIDTSENINRGRRAGPLAPDCLYISQNKSRFSRLPNNQTMRSARYRAMYRLLDVHICADVNLCGIRMGKKQRGKKDDIAWQILNAKGRTEGYKEG